MTTPPLVAFAILSVNWDEHRVSYTHNFLPFIAHCLANASREDVGEREIQDSLQTEFGLELPQAVIKTIMRRAVKEDLVEKRHGRYLLNKSNLRKYALNSRRTELQQDYDHLLDSFIRYSLDECALVIPRDAAEHILLNYIIGRGLPILRASIRRHAIELDEIPSSQYGYVTSKFVIDLYETRDPMFTVVESIVKGSILASAIYLPDFDSPGRPIRDLQIYLDTPFLIDLVGLARGPENEAATELIGVLRSLGAELTCFEHTLYETQGVLRSAAIQLESLAHRSDASRAYPPVVRYCLESNLRSSDLAVKVETLASDLADMKIEVVDSPPHSPALTLDEEELDATLRSQVRYWHDNALRRDLQSLTGIYRLRSGRPKRRLESAKAIFATPNSGLVRASQIFFREKPRGDLVPVCALDSELATIAWIKRPTAAPDLLRKQLIADCYSANEPNDLLWSKYLNEIDRLVDAGTFSDSDYYVLRFSVEATRALMDETLGDAERLTAESIQSVLAATRHDMRGEAEGDIASALREKQEAESEAERMKDEVSSAQELRKRAEKHVGQVLLAQSKRFAVRVVRSLGIILVAAILAAAIATPLARDSGALLIGVSIGAGALVAVLTVLQALYGSSQVSLATQWRTRLTDWRYERLRRPFQDVDLGA